MMLATFLFILLSKNSYDTLQQDAGKHIHTAYVLRVPNARYT